MYRFDLTAFRAINIGLHSTFLDPFFLVLSYLGLGQVTGAVCLLFLIKPSTRYLVVPLILADAIGGLGVAQVLKTFVDRDRPSNLSWAITQEHWTSASFPSGHTTTAFAVSVMLVLLTWDTKLRTLGLATLPVAILVGISRIYRGVHWPTDVLAGACFGTATACILYLVLPKFGMNLSPRKGS